MFIESIKSWLVIFDSWVYALIDGFNTFDNNAISMDANLTRVHSDLSMVDDLIFLGPIGLILAFVSLLMDAAYNYRYRNTWDAYLRRELDRLEKKLIKRMTSLSEYPTNGLNPEYQRAFEKIAVLLNAYEADTQMLKQLFSGAPCPEEIGQVETQIATLKQKLALIFPNNTLPLQTHQPERSTASSADDPVLDFLKKEARRRKAKILDHLEEDPYLGLAQFSDSSWFKVPFAFAWGYWFVFFFTMWGIATGFVAVPLTWALFSFICPLLYLGYKEIVRYHMRFLEEPIDPTNLMVDGIQVTLNSDQIEKLLQCRPQALIILTEDEIEAISDPIKQESAQNRRVKALELCRLMGLQRNVPEEKQFECLEMLRKKINTWKSQQDQTDLFGFKGFRAGWIFLAAVAGLSASMIYGFSALYSPLLGIGVFAGVLLAALVITRILDLVGEARAKFLKEDDSLEEVEEKIALDEQEKNQFIATAASTREWAFIREQWQKKMLLELAALESAIALDRLGTAASVTFDVTVNQSNQPFVQPDRIDNKPLSEERIKALKDQVDSMATRLEKVRGILVTGLEFAMGYMMACIIGFVALDFLGHLKFFEPFVDSLSSNFLVGALGLLSGASSARRAWLNEQAHLSDLEINRLNQEYLNQQDELTKLNDTNASLRIDLTARLKNEIEYKPESEALKKLDAFIKKPAKTFELNGRKLLNFARKALFVLTSISTVMLMSRALIVMGFTKAYAAPTVGGSLALFGVAGPSPLGIAVLSLAAVFLLWRIANKMYMSVQKEQEQEKIACVGRRLDEAKMENTQLSKVSQILNNLSKSSPTVTSYYMPSSNAVIDNAAVPTVVPLPPDSNANLESNLEFKFN